MRQAVELKGQPASDGIFAGPIFILGAAETERRRCGDADAECRAFDDAVAAAVSGLTALVETAEGDGTGACPDQTGPIRR
jgi:phosphoenolpyruvate-protein kinase (PTS system EI component)